MAVTRGAQHRHGGQHGAEAAGEQQQLASTAVAFAERRRRELDADRAMLDTYRRDWRQPKGIGAALLTCVRPDREGVAPSERLRLCCCPPASSQMAPRHHLGRPCRHLRDVAWWLEHVCGVNMLDYEEKAVVLCVFGGTLALIALGAYKQGAALAGPLQAIGAQLARSLQELAALAAARLYA